MPVSSSVNSLFVSEEARPFYINTSLERSEVVHDWLAEPFVIESGSCISLVPDPSCPLFRRLLTTQDLDVFKSWVGVPNAMIESGALKPPSTLPHVQPRRLEQAKDRLSTAELADLKRAFDYFVFGRSGLVEDYRDAIVMHYSPFEVAVYAGRHVEIMPGASVEVIDVAAVLEIDRLVIHSGGHLRLFTPAKVRINTLHKDA